MKRSITKYIGYIALSLSCLLPLNTPHAQTKQQDPPIVITADDTLEWHRADQIFIATTNAHAKQGDTDIRAQKLEALYTDSQDSNFDIHTMRAIKDVIIYARDSKAYGDLAIYDVTREKATMTGQNLRVISTDQKLEARDKFEYYVTDGKLIAYGDAIITRPKPGGQVDTLKADRIEALFENNDQGERVLKTTEAFDNVVITTPTEIITGAYGIYHANTNLAELEGGVTVRRGPNLLEGDRAQVDLNTNISTLFSDKNKQGQERVRGVFYPSSEKK